MDVMEILQNKVQKMTTNNPAHDFEHIMRVYRNAQYLCKKEKANEKIVLSAALLHDIVSYPKSDPRSKLSSSESAKEAKKILTKLNFTDNDIKMISDAIHDHSYSIGVTPKTMEGKILQDADRLDAIGAIGIARVFAVSGSENRPFYHPDDPFCKFRDLDDKQWALDHFFEKLLKLESIMNTESARIEAKKRNKILKLFLNQLKKEL